MNIKDKINTALDSLTDYDREMLTIAGNHLLGGVVFELGRTLIIYRIGRKIAPNVFKSFGRTYTLIYLVSLATARPKLSEDQKTRLAALRAKKKAAQDPAAAASEALQQYARKLAGNQR